MSSDNKIDSKIQALAEHLGFNNELESFAHNLVDRSKYDDCFFEICGQGDFFVLTNEEADKRAKEYILETVWAFSTDFLQAHARKGVDISDLDDYRSKVCEDANATMLALIENVNDFVDAAIAADGRGHFLSSYDGEEHEVNIGDEDFFIYRTN